MYFQNIFLQASQGGSLMSTFIMIGGILLVFYFFMIRPQQKRQKTFEKFRSSVKKGDKVVTIGGLHGKVHALDEDTITIEVDKSVKLTFDKASLSIESTQKHYPNNTSSVSEEK